MNIDNMTPFSFGSFVNIDSDAKYSSTIFIKATFELAPDVVGQPLEEQPFPQPDINRQDFGLEGVSLAYPSDFATWKPRADILFVGSAYRPDKHPNDHYRIGLRVGGIAKQLIVNTNGPDAASVPISYENAYGGIGFEQNPVGLGYKQTGTPRIQYPNQSKRIMEDRSPASFGPIPPEWEPRKSKFGKFKGDAEERWPGFPRNFDWAYFNSAPLDQQFDGFLVGNEEIVLENMIAGQTLFSTRLPGVRVIAIREDLEKQSTTIDMNLDTLWIDGDQMRLILIWRGQMPIETPECFEIKRIGFLAEGLETPLKDAPYYRDQIDAVLKTQNIEFEEEPPAIDTETEPPTPDAPTADNVEKEDQQTKTLNAEIAAVKTCMGIKEPEVPADPKPLSLKDAPPLPPDLQSKIDEAMAKMDEQDREFEANEAELKWTREKVIAAVKNHDPFEGIDLSGIDLSQCEFADANFQGATMEGVNFKGSVLSRTRFDGCNLQNTIFDEAKLESANFESADLTGSRLVGGDLRQAVLNEANFSNATIENSDLSGSVSKKSSFGGASIRRVNWQGAELTGASFDNSRVENSDFRKTMLGDASFVSAKLSTVRLDDADISYAAFGQAIFQDAILDRVTAEGTDFTDANLAGASFKQAQCKGAWFSSANIAGANFEGASCTEVQLDGTSARKANFMSADITSFRGGENADLTGACFQYAHGMAPIFESCFLDDADFSGADIEGANFIKASLIKTRLIATEMKFSRFDYANCNQTRFDHANLFESGFADSDLTDANFTGANVYASEFLNAKIDGIVLKDTNIKMTELNSWRRT